MKYTLFFFIFFITIACKINKYNCITIEKGSFSSWHHKDLTLDSIPGISLEKWYAENSSKKTKNEIIIAVLDTQIDLNHEDLQGQLWVNKEEIPNNGIDDDKNGYLDDVNGWNFIGLENNKTQIYVNFEFIRYINKYKNLFEEQKDSINNISSYKEYKRAKAKYSNKHNYYNLYLTIENKLISAYYPAKDTLKYYFPKEDYTISILDSMYNKYKTNNKNLEEKLFENKEFEFDNLIFYMKTIKEFDYTIEGIENSKKHNDSILNRLLNFNYNDRNRILNENSKKNYGNNTLNSSLQLLTHSTKVSSVIAANRDNNIGVKGFHQNIKVMPISISSYGDEHDKDIANAIYYAVDNGAKVINMSFSEEFSVDQKSVIDAMKYAENHNVLLVHVSGNGSSNIDVEPFYPSDIDYLEDPNEELANNLITVGSISKRMDSTLVANTSNYGKQNVDLFAPGEEIYIAKPDNEYEYNSGTSFAAPMVSGTAALIWLYYPKLTVQEVKNIILESGVAIDKMVIKPGTEDEMIHFSELCKTGKILNSYNAMKMAEEVSKRKK